MTLGQSEQVLNGNAQHGTKFHRCADRCFSEIIWRGARGPPEINRYAFFRGRGLTTGAERGRRLTQPASVEWIRRSPTTSVSPVPRERLTMSLLSAPR